MDDNAAQTDAAENPYLSIAIPQVQAAYDSMYDAVKYLLEGKDASLKQVDQWLAKWEKKLQWIVEKYRELLGKFDELSGSLSSAVTLDIAKEAWEILQDFPILRRYLGEANYWLLYDTVGLAATQGASIAADLSTAVKEAIKAAIKALLAMTDGLMSIESYLGAVSQYWGALYVKTIPLPLLDSIVPNVTCSYFYKPSVSSENGLANPVPGPGGFIPVPLPIPNPEYQMRHPGSSLLPDYNDPDSWVDETGMAKYLNIEAFRDALEYWGSSYFNETIPGITSADPKVPAIYKRRPYIRGTEEEAHPLRVGHTFAQLDTSKTVVAYGGAGNANDEESLKRFEQLWDDPGFRQALEDWQAAWDDARSNVVALLKASLSGKMPILGADGTPIAAAPGTPAVGEFTSMRQVRYESGDARDEAYAAYCNALFSGRLPNGAPSPRPEVGAELQKVRNATVNLVKAYLTATGVSTAGIETTTAYSGLPQCLELTTLLAKAAVAMRHHVPQSSKYLSADDCIPVFGRNWSHDGKLQYLDGLNQFMRVLPTAAIPDVPTDAESPTADELGIHFYSLDLSAYGLATDPASIWATTPTMESDAPEAAWETYMLSLVYPTLEHPMPATFYKRDDAEDGTPGEVLKATEHPLDDQIGMGTIKDGALSIPSSWENYRADTASVALWPTCGFFIGDDIDKAPTTVIGALLDMMGDKESLDNSLEEEIADEVGYSILKGRQPLAACFDVYGELITMAGWCFQAMPTAALPEGSPTASIAAAAMQKFNETYARIPGSSLWYEIADPKTVVYRHSTFYSATKGMPYTIYHKAMASRTYSRGSEHYDFYVFPTESVSVQELKENSLGALRTADATGPDGRQYHYIVMRNAVPKCPRYVDLEKWSVMDIIHELYLLAWGMSPFCGDNGDRYAKLEAALESFGVTPPEFIGQLPADNGKAADFEVTLFTQYAKRIERLVDSIYRLREEIFAATEAW